MGDRVCAIIAAAGKGKRMGKNINKQFLHICGMPVLYYTLKKFEDALEIDDIYISADSKEISYIEENIISKYNFRKVKKVVAGGNERQDSVLLALRNVNDCSIVLIHDGARPFVNEDIISRGINFAKAYGAAACGVLPKDTIKVRREDGFSDNTLDRSKLYAIQTPQCFKFDMILKCHEIALTEGKKFTDDTAVVEEYGYKVYLYPGDYSNIKITTPIDINIAEAIIKS